MSRARRASASCRGPVSGSSPSFTMWRITTSTICQNKTLLSHATLSPQTPPGSTGGATRLFLEANSIAAKLTHLSQICVSLPSNPENVTNPSICSMGALLPQVQQRSPAIDLQRFLRLLNTAIREWRLEMGPIPVTPQEAVCDLSSTGPLVAVNLFILAAIPVLLLGLRSSAGEGIPPGFYPPKHL